MPFHFAPPFFNYVTRAQKLLLFITRDYATFPEKNYNYVNLFNFFDNFTKASLT